MHFIASLHYLYIKKLYNTVSVSNAIFGRTTTVISYILYVSVTFNIINEHSVPFQNQTMVIKPESLPDSEPLPDPDVTRSILSSVGASVTPRVLCMNSTYDSMDSVSR